MGVVDGPTKRVREGEEPIATVRQQPLPLETAQVLRELEIRLREAKPLDAAPVSARLTPADPTTRVAAAPSE